jgi:hypothetical protein
MHRVGALPGRWRGPFARMAVVPFVLGRTDPVSIEYVTIAVGAFLAVVLLVWRLRSIEIRLHAVEMRSGKIRKDVNFLLTEQSRDLLVALNGKPNADGPKGEPCDASTAPNGNEVAIELDTERFALGACESQMQMLTLDQTKRLLSRIEADLGR